MCHPEHGFQQPQQLEIYASPTPGFSEPHRRGIRDLKTLLEAEREEERKQFLEQFVKRIPTKKKREEDAKQKLCQLVEKEKSNSTFWKHLLMG